MDSRRLRLLRVKVAARLPPREELKSHQVVGEVTAHQAEDG